MGCGGSKGTGVVDVTDYKQEKHRAKTPSISSSSSGISSYRRSQSLRQSDRPGSDNTPRDLNQNNEEQHNQQNSQKEKEEQLAAEQQKLEAKAEEERRLQEQAFAAEEQRRRQEQAQSEEARRQKEALSQQQRNQVVLPMEQTVATGQEQEGGKSFSPLKIFQHNHEIGWIEWIPYKSKVYDCNGIRAYFPGYMQNRLAMLEARARQRLAEGGEEKEKEFVTFITPSMCDRFPSITDHEAWCYNGIILLRVHGISEEELAKELPRFLMGNITGTSGPAYFDGIRKDVATLLEDLQAPLEESQPSGQQEYQALLMRWQNKYGAMDPPSQPPATDGTDPNKINFPLPVDPESLRLFLLEGENLDFEIPAEGAWSTFEIEKIDLGEPDKNFLATLRVDFETEELIFEVEGEVAWEVLSDSAIKEDQMTPKQEEIQAARDKRTDLNDMERMKRRREQLRDYFIQTRELAPDVVMPFLQWASLLEASQAELDKLCS